MKPIDIYYLICTIFNFLSTASQKKEIIGYQVIGAGWYQSSLQFKFLPKKVALDYIY